MRRRTLQRPWPRQTLTQPQPAQQQAFLHPTYAPRVNCEYAFVVLVLEEEGFVIYVYSVTGAEIEGTL